MTKLSHYSNVILAGISLLLGISIGYVQLTQENGGFPNKDELIMHTGYLDSITEYKYGIRFVLSNDNHHFNYPSKSGSQDKVYQALLNAGDKEIKVLFEANVSRKPTYTSKEYHDVFELHIGDNIIRSYSESEKAWKSDNLLLPLIIFMFLSFPIYVWWKNKQQRLKAIKNRFKWGYRYR